MSSWDMEYATQFELPNFGIGRSRVQFVFAAAAF